MMRGMQVFIQFIIGYVMLYAVIWAHEVGHAFFYWKYGCKKNLFQVTVKPSLFFSTPAPVDEEKSDRLNTRQSINIGYGGIMVNIFFSILFTLLIPFISTTNVYILSVFWLFLTLHMAEAVSYLFIGDLFLVSDMASIAEQNKNLRWVNLALGILLTIFYIYILSIVPENLKWITILYNVLTIGCMSAGRIIFTYFRRNEG